MIRDIDLHIGKRLRRRRRLLGLTQQELAGAVGVRFQQIQKYECAANAISASRLFELAKCLEVSVQYFYDGFEASQARHAASSHWDSAGPSVGLPVAGRIGAELRP